MNAESNLAAQDARESPQKIWNIGFISVFVANACMYLAQQMMNSLIAKYADSLGATPSVVGQVVSMFAITALVFKIISGPAIDSFNRRFILMGAMCIMAIAFFGYSISASIPILKMFRLVQGCAQAFTATCCLALAADTLPTDKFGAGIGIFSLAQASAQAIGPTVALALMGAVGYKITFMIGGCLMVVAAFVACNVRVSYQRTKAFRIQLSNIVAKEVIMPASIICFLSIVFCVINSFLIIYAGKQGVQNIGFYFTVYAGTLLITRPMVGKLTDRFGIVKVVIPAMFFFAASFLLISISNTLYMFLLAGFISAFGYGACQPAIQTLAMKSVPVSRRGAASSTVYVGTDSGNLIGPIIAGGVVEAVGYNVMWRVMILPIFISMGIVILCRKRISKVEKDFRSQKS